MPFFSLFDTKVYWNIDNACHRTTGAHAIDEKGINTRPDKIGEVRVAPADGNLERDAPNNGKLVLTQLAGPPEAYFNNTNCPIIKYTCILQIIHSTDTKNQDIIHLVEYKSDINITVIGKFVIVTFYFVAFCGPQFSIPCSSLESRTIVRGENNRKLIGLYAFHCHMISMPKDQSTR